jgi:hypothetical protein
MLKLTSSGVLICILCFWGDIKVIFTVLNWHWISHSHKRCRANHYELQFRRNICEVSRLSTNVSRSILLLRRIECEGWVTRTAHSCALSLDITRTAHVTLDTTQNFVKLFLKHWVKTVIPGDSVKWFTLYVDIGMHWSQDRSVGVAMGYELDGRRIGVWFQKWTREFYLLHSPQTGLDQFWGSHSLLPGTHRRLFPLELTTHLHLCRG